MAMAMRVGEGGLIHSRVVVFGATMLHTRSTHRKLKRTSKSPPTFPPIPNTVSELRSNVFVLRGDGFGVDCETIFHSNFEGRVEPEKQGSRFNTFKL